MFFFNILKLSISRGVPCSLCLFVIFSCNRKSHIEIDGSHVETQTVLNTIHSEGDLAQEFLNRWDKACLGEDINLLKNSQTDIVREATLQLAESVHFLSFIEGLYARDEYDLVDEIVEKNYKSLFAGLSGDEARERLLSVRNEKLQALFAFYAGYNFVGPNFKEFLIRVNNAKAQERLLTGYACRIAEKNSPNAVVIYKQLRPENCSFYGLLDVMEYLDPAGDFAKVDLTYPDDYDEVNNMGYELRRRMLKRWAKFDHLSAAEYILANSKRVKFEQLRGVLEVWYEQSPDDLMNWVNSISKLESKDIALSYLVAIDINSRRFKESWILVNKISNFELKVKTATEAFIEWAKIDRKAAEAAWVQVFPQ